VTEAPPTLRVLIVDDEAPAREGLRLRLQREPGVSVVGETESAAQADALIASLSPDLVLVDVEMPGATGFSVVAHASGADGPQFVFVTAHAEYAVKAFAVRAADYLLKPVEQSRLREALSRARERLAQRVTSRLSVTKGGAVHLIPTAGIDWIEARGDFVRVHADQTVYTLNKTMTGVMESLDATRFVRIHRSAIVNAERIRQLVPSTHGEYIVVLASGARLKLTRSYRAELPRLLRRVPRP
jgi:two-component system LytT family response regulator